MAQKRAKTALEMKTSLLGLNDTGTLARLGLLATVLSDQGKYEEAKEMYQQALRPRETVLGKGIPTQ
jgi:tetratricopeptide (TPR) repeat protein